MVEFPQQPKPPILLVDDDAGILHLLADWVREEGFEPSACTSGRQAMEILDTWNSGIVVADLNMPGMDGLTLCRALRGAGRPWSPYFILLTGDDRPDLLDEAFEAGVDDFVRKPVGHGELRGRLRAAVRLVRLGEDLRERAEGELEHRLHESAMSELREVVSTLAHDLRTPIGALRTTAEMLNWKADILPPEAAKLCQRMVALSIHLSDTVTDVADAFVCEDHDPLRQNWTEFDLREVCCKACELVGGAVSAEVSLQPPASSPPFPMRGNPLGIRRLLVNLLSNALRATRIGQVRLEVEPSGDPGFVCCTVTDTGEGISSELLPHLGRPLMLSSGAAIPRRAIHGAGLGLAISRRLVAHHGGRILVASKPGDTRVRVWLRTDLPEPLLDLDYSPLDTELIP